MIFAKCYFKPNRNVDIFPNFFELSPTTYGKVVRVFQIRRRHCALLNKTVLAPSHRNMPAEYFLFKAMKKAIPQNAAVGFI